MTRRTMEVERKWLVEAPPNLSKLSGVKIVQGYIAVSAEGIEVRLRRKGKKFFQTVKSGAGLERGEIEVELSKKQFTPLWRATRKRRLEKVRYTLKYCRKKVELDIYKLRLTGLVVAEVEFKSRKESANFLPPPWFGKEVTEDEDYKNVNLAAPRETKYKRFERKFRLAEAASLERLRGVSRSK